MKIAINTDSRKQQLEDEAKSYRDQFIDSNIEVFGVMWQVGTKDRDNITSAIDTAALLGANAPSGIEWILADNSTRQTTLADLQEVLIRHALRRLAVFQQYIAWRAGSRTQPFHYVANG